MHNYTIRLQMDFLKSFLLQSFLEIGNLIRALFKFCNTIIIALFALNRLP